MKQELVNSALEVLKAREKKAKDIANQNKAKALSDETFKKIYDKFTSSIVACAKGEIEEVEVNKIEKQLNLRLIELGIKSIEPEYSCKHCEDTGFVDGHYCSCLKSEISKILIKNSGFTKLNSFSDANFDIFSNKEEIEKIYLLMKKWCEKQSEKTLVYLLGNTGNEFINQGKIVYMTTAFNLSQDFLKFHRSFDDKQKADVFENYLKTEVLFIDDLGTEPIYNNVTREYMYLLINERQLKGLKTIITSNLEPIDIREKYDERIFSRIMDKQHSIVLKLDSKDVRLK